MGGRQQCRHQSTIHDPGKCYPRSMAHYCYFIGLQRAKLITWWRHQMETFSALLALCVWNSPIPLTKASDAELRCFLWAAPWINNREASDLRRHRAYYDVIVMMLSLSVSQLRVSLSSSGRVIHTRTSTWSGEILIWHHPMSLMCHHVSVNFTWRKNIITPSPEQNYQHFEDDIFKCSVLWKVSLYASENEFIHQNQHWARSMAPWCHEAATQKAKFLGPTWGPPGSCRPPGGPHVGPINFAFRVWIMVNLHDGWKH